MKKSAFIFVIFVSFTFLFQLTCVKQAKAAVEPNIPKTESAGTDANAAPAPEPNADPAADPNAPQPILKLESALHDFGDVGMKTVNICHFKFTNIGKGTLIIKDVKATCGCTIPGMEK